MLTSLLLASFLAGCTYVTENKYFVYDTPVPSSPDTTNDTADHNEFDTAVEVIPGIDWRDSCLPADQFADALFSNDYSTDGLRFWFDVTDEQLAKMYEDWSMGWWGGGYYVYDTPGEESDATYADLFIFDTYGVCYTFGEVEVAITGQSTGCEWGTPGCLAPLRIDSNEFQKGLKIGAEEKEHLALHPGSVSYLASEPTTYEILKRMGEAVPNASLVWVGSNAYGGDGDTWIPYNLVEKYDTDWNAEHADQLHGGFSFGLWEGWSQFSDYQQSECEFGSDDCDETAEQQVAQELGALGYSETFVADTSSLIDHTAVQRQLCESYLLWTGDDVFHNTNNVVKGGQVDGTWRYLPYSIDLSAGASGWYIDTTIFGWDWYSNQCSTSEVCRNSVFDTCGAILTEYTTADPVGVVTNFCERLETQGMMRSGDEEECDRLTTWHTARLEEFDGEVSCYRTQYEEMYAPADTGGGEDTYYSGYDSEGDTSPVKGGGGGGDTGSTYVDCSTMMNDYLY